MAFPTVADSDTQSGHVTSNSNSWTLTYPTNIASGDLLLLFVALDGDTYINSLPSGWLTLTQGVPGATNVTLSTTKKLAVGTETGTFTMGLTGSEQGSWWICRIPAATWAGTLGTNWDNAATGGSVLWNGTYSTGSQYPDPPSLDPFNWDVTDTLWFAIMASDHSDTVTAFPGGYSSTYSDTSGGANGATLAHARRELAASSEDPGSFTLSGTEEWCAVTLAIRGVGGSVSGSLSADAVIAPRRFTADAQIAVVRTGTPGFSATTIYLLGSLHNFYPVATGTPTSSVSTATETGVYNNEHFSGFDLSWQETERTLTTQTTYDYIITQLLPSGGWPGTSTAIVFRSVIGPLAAQTISGSVSFSSYLYVTYWSYQTGSARMSLAVWRPSTQTIVGRLYDGAGSATDEWSITQGYMPSTPGVYGTSGARSMSSVTAQAGDFLIFEAWLNETFTVDPGGYSTPGYVGTYTSAGQSLLTFSNAITVADWPFGITLDATFLRRPSGSLTADAAFYRAQTYTFAADAVIVAGAGTRTGSVSANAVLFRSKTDTISADAQLVHQTSASITAAATFKRIISATTTADAVLLKGLAGSITADAEIVGQYTTQTGSVTADALIFKSPISTLSADSRLLTLRSSSFNADGRFLKVTQSTFNADAYVSLKFTASAVTKGTLAGSFGGGAYVYRPRTSPSPPAPTPLVAITVGGVDITADVVYSSATFTMKVNGAVGSFQMRVRDTAHSHTFTSGAEVIVEIDGKERFGGYLTQIGHSYAFDVDLTTDSTETPRFWDLSGVDYNILLAKRVLYDKDNLANMNLREWPAGSRDDDIIRYVITNYSDLLDDGVTLANISHIGTPNPDKAAVIGSAGLTVLDALTEMNRLLAGVFYIGPGKDLFYVDVDTVTAPFGLSDTPGAGQLGYREFEFVENGTNLVNDALVWGVGMGWPEVAFARTEDADSIAAHGRWQSGELTNGLYKQASVDARADSIVYGSPQSLRGGKDDKRSWNLKLYDAPFIVGQVVQVESSIFDINDAVPIRALTLRFSSPTHYWLDLTLSHEIDEPWNLFEWYFPPLLPIQFPHTTWGSIDWPDFEIPQPGGCICGITDTFTRTVASGWGTSDSTLPWSYSLNSGFSVDGSVGHLVTAFSKTASLTFLTSGWDRTVEVRFSYPTATATRFASGITTDGDGSTCVLQVSAGNLAVTGLTAPGSGSHTDEGSVGPWPIWTQGTWYRLKYHVTSDRIEAKVWVDGTSEPNGWGAWQQHATPAAAYGTSYLQLVINQDMDFDNLDITGIDRCTQYRFDNFDRTVASGWGVSDAGLPWNSSNVGSGATLSVDGSSGVMFFPGDQNVAETDVWVNGVTGMPDGQSFTIKSRFQFSRVPTGVFPDMSLYLQWWVGNVDLIMVTISSGTNGRIESRFGTYTPLSVWSPNTWYVLEVSYDWTTDTSTSRVYVDGTTPPSWQTVFSSVGHPTGNTNLEIDVQDDTQMTPSSKPTQTLMVGYIDFDYTGKPCYADCGPFDTFTRTVADGWGVPDAGSAYEWSDASSATVSVDGSRGVVVMPTGKNANLQQPLPAADLIWTSPGDIYWDIEFANMPSGSHYNVWFSGGYDTAAGVRFLPGIGIVDVTATHQNFDTSYEASFTPSGRLSVHFQVDDAGIRAKVWAYGSAEPDTWTVFDTWFGSYRETGLQCQFGGSNGSGSGLDFTFYIDNIRIVASNGVVCGIVPVMAGAGSGGSTPIGGSRDDSTSTGSQTIQLNYAYIAGSVRVYVDGVFWRPGIDFTETSPAMGTITLTEAPTAGSAISVLAESAGPRRE